MDFGIEMYVREKACPRTVDADGRRSVINPVLQQSIFEPLTLITTGVLT